MYICHILFAHLSVGKHIGSFQELASFWILMTFDYLKLLQCWNICLRINITPAQYFAASGSREGKTRWQIYLMFRASLCCVGGSTLEINGLDLEPKCPFHWFLPVKMFNYHLVWEPEHRQKRLINPRMSDCKVLLSVTVLVACFIAKTKYLTLKIKGGKVHFSSQFREVSVQPTGFKAGWHGRRAQQRRNSLR